MKYDILAAGRVIRRGLTLREAAFYTDLEPNEITWAIEEHGQVNVLGPHDTELTIKEASDDTLHMG